MEAIDGLINFYKPVGITSAKALYAVRKLTGQRKSGHTGTLDPAAEGVLVLGLGKGTKLTELLMDQSKVYRAKARLDVTSESFDSDRPLIVVPVSDPPDRDSVLAALNGFVGEIEQIPPAISAIKVGGQRAYKLNRQGEAVELKPRPARIYWVHLHEYEWPNVEFEMACGRGTYVRALIRDLGTALNTGGCLTGLVRTRVGPFSIGDALSLDALAEFDADSHVVPTEQARSLLQIRPVPIPTKPSA